MWYNIVVPIISYTIRNSACKTVRNKKCWYYEYEQILVDVNDAVAKFLEEDDKREKRYLWKIKKQMQDARIHTVFSLDEMISFGDGAESSITDIIEDNVNPENYDPLEIVVEKEIKEEQKRVAASLDEMCASLMTKKQYEVWQYSGQGFNVSEIAKILNIDESSVRERLQNALKRISQSFWQ